MTALEALNAAAGRLTSITDKVIEAWNKPNPTEEAINAAAAQVNAQADRLDGLVNPPAPTPA